jgi:hypothetical protein
MAYCRLCCLALRHTLLLRYYATMSHLTILPTGQSGATNDPAGDEPAFYAQSTDPRTTAGEFYPRHALANFYVAVKSCPLIILAGPAESGKLTLAQSTAHLLGGSRRAVTVPGHARWAAGSIHSSELVEAQTQLNKSALFALMEEAWQPEQQGRPFVVCLRRISPAELRTFFTRQGLDLLYRQFLGWQLTQPLPPLPLPPNLTLIATLDTGRFRWWDAALLNAATVVPWPNPVAEARPTPHLGQLPPLCSGNFFHNAVRDASVAHKRLRQLLVQTTTPFARLLQVGGALEEAGVYVPPGLMNRVVVFAANAWSESGAGLFALEPPANLDCALQLGIIQHLLPWLVHSQYGEVMRTHALPHLDQTYEPLVRLLVG